MVQNPKTTKIFRNDKKEMNLTKIISPYLHENDKKQLFF